MPELPEVETVRQTLKNFILGRKITEVMVFYDVIVKQMNVQEFRLRCIGQTFHDIRRKGKYLFFDLDDYTLVSHLRMEGKYYLRNDISECSKHEHVIFQLDNEKLLSFHDVRKFGTMDLVPLRQEDLLDSIQSLGKEINDPTLNATYLYPKVKKANRPIKSILLDQTIVCGLGNIYVDETLFLARIHPNTLGRELNLHQVDLLIQSAKSVIDEAIDMGGTTIRTYHSSLGVDGLFQNKLNVHTLVDQPCKTCGDIIQKIKVGGRGTYFCPTCQRRDRMYIIGLTGGIASGKSLISKWFRNYKVSVLDADKIYKNLLKTNKIMYNEIVNHFGVEIMTDGAIDRKKLGSIIFRNKEKRELLNQLTHPYVLQTMNRRISSLRSKGKELIVLDIPLMFEANMEYLVDAIIVAYVNPDVQLQRLMERDHISKTVAMQRIQSQMSLEMKKDKADFVIDNSYSLEETKEQFLSIFNKLRRDRYVF